jgi:hypothetical protein
MMGATVENFKELEAGAETIQLSDVDLCMTEWSKAESVDIVTQILRCLRAALAYNARGEVRSHLAENHSKAVLDLSEKILTCDIEGDESSLARARCCLQVLVSASADSDRFRDQFLAHRVQEAAFDCLNAADEKVKRFTAILLKLYLEKSNESVSLTGEMLSRLLSLLVASECGSSAESLSVIQTVLVNKISVLGRNSPIFLQFFYLFSIFFLNRF